MRRPIAHRTAAAAALLALSAALPSRAAAYDRQISLGVTAGWGVAPALVDGLPDHGPTGGVSATIGLDDAWGLGAYAGWAVHPPFTEPADAFQLGLFGIEGLYYIDILEVVPFFGLGVDVLPSHDGSVWGADFAAHVRASLDYLLSREVVLGLDVRAYVLLTALDLDPVYLTFQARVSFLFDY